VKWVYDDGGRAAAGFRGRTGDCVVRAVAIASQQPYAAVYADMQAFIRGSRQTKLVALSNVRTGVHKPVIRRYLFDRGWIWTPTMGIGTGTTVHLHDGALPTGRLIVSVTKHLTAVLDGIIHDTHDPSRCGTRCVYGWYEQQPNCR
jgi:hypothetical protein